MLSCKNVTRIIASDEFATAKWSRRLAVRFHHLMCRHCRRYAAQLRAIAQLARKHLGAGEEDTKSSDRLKHAILKRFHDGQAGAAGPCQGQESSPTDSDQLGPQ